MPRDLDLEAALHDLRIALHCRSKSGQWSDLEIRQYAPQIVQMVVGEINLMVGALRRSEEIERTKGG